KELMNGQRIHELVLLESLIKSNNINLDQFKKKIRSYDGYVDNNVINSVINVLSLNFYTAEGKDKYGGKGIVTFREDEFKMSKSFETLIKNEQFKELFTDVIRVALSKNKEYIQNERLTLYNKYTRKDVCRLLDWDTDNSATIFGYKVYQDTCPIFVTYSKSSDIDNNVKYEDQFLNQRIFKWYTRNPRKIDSPEVQKILSGSESGSMKIPLFIKKSDDEGKDFFYMGMVAVDKSSVVQESMPGKTGAVPVVTMNFVLNNSVPYDKYVSITDVPISAN
ncbi:DUF3427 domain-containing protein, partial [Secundilactobacillus malefermentans]